MATRPELEDQLLQIIQTSTVLEPSPEGAIDRETQFESLKMLLCLSLILDDDFIFPVVKGVADKLGQSLQKNIDSLNKLLSPDGLFGLGQSSISSVGSTNLSEAFFHATVLSQDGHATSASLAKDSLNKYLTNDLISKKIRGNCLAKLI